MAPRTAHRVVCGLEDAGFEVCDQYLWLYGQGFPKSLLIARRIDVSLCRQEARHYTVVLPKGKKRKPRRSHLRGDARRARVGRVGHGAESRVRTDLARAKTDGQIDHK